MQGTKAFTGFDEISFSLNKDIGNRPRKNTVDFR